MIKDHEKTLRAFMDEWGKSYEAVLKAYDEYLADNVLWDQPPMGTTHTKQEAIALLRDFNQKVGLATFRAEVLNVAVNGDVAFAERIDHLARADGSSISSFPVTGVFKFDEDGKIFFWREYFDAAPVVKAFS